MPVSSSAPRPARAMTGWHSFTGYDAETGAAKHFFIEFFLCNPELGGDEPVFGQIPGKPQNPSYLMVKAGAWGEDAAQLHRFWGWKRIQVDWGVPFSIEADDCFLTEDRTHGGLKPLRTYSGPRYTAGVSDHLPIVLMKKN